MSKTFWRWCNFGFNRIKRICIMRSGVQSFYPLSCLDAVIADISRRFDQKNIEIMHAIQACSPKSEKFLSPLHFVLLWYRQRINWHGDKISKENTWTKGELRAHPDVFKSLIPLKDAFPELIKLIRIAMTIAVNTAHCEWSFSALKRIKTHLRSMVCEQRLTDLAILSMEREISGMLSLDEVIDRFAGIDQNRRMLL